MDLTLLNAITSLEQPDGLIALPGPDGYLLAVRPDRPLAFQRLYRLRSQPEPLLLMGFDVKALLPFIQPLEDSAQRLIQKYWPGPLIILTEAIHHLPEGFSPFKQIKIWQPNHSLLLDCLSLLPPGALVTLEAARSHHPVARTAKAVLDNFGEDVDWVVPDDDLVLESLAPTVVWTKPNQEIQLLRSGAIVLD